MQENLFTVSYPVLWWCTIKLIFGLQKFQYFWRSSRNDCGLELEHRKIIFLNDTLADDDASPYWVWPIRDIVQANIHWSSEPSLWPWPCIQQSNLFTRHSSLWTCTVKLSWSPQKISSSEHIIEIVIFDWMNRNSVTVTLTLRIETHFFAYDALAYNYVSPYRLWLQMVQRCIKYPN